MVRRVDPAVLEKSEHAADNAATSIDGWLNVLTRLLRLPSAEQQAIRDELAEHLHERTRDLMLGGASEEEALRVSIGELGETADLAQRFRAARHYRIRRTAMHASLVVLGAGFMGLGLLTIQPQGTTPAPMRVSVFETQVAEDDPALEERISLELSETTVEATIESLAAVTGRPIHAHWRRLEEVGLDRTSTVTLKLVELPTQRVFELLLQELEEGCMGLAWHFSPDLIELGVREEFDRREIELKSYDIGDVLRSMQHEYDLEYSDAAEQIATLIHEMVSPNEWMANGGDLSQLKLVGGRMFVQAPPRTHRQVEWILGQLSAGIEVGGADDGGATRHQVTKGVRRLQTGDIVTVQIYELYQPGEWFISKARLDETGVFRVPEIGDVPAAGLTADQLEEHARRELGQKVMANPRVLVLVERPARGAIVGR